ncbi:MAG: hypothetical protein Q4G03_01395 [Planctomycetia bacterium]|nr:hypothetical protein [Planctomycetia bacterium]
MDKPSTNWHNVRNGLSNAFPPSQQRSPKRHYAIPLCCALLLFSLGCVPVAFAQFVYPANDFGNGTPYFDNGMPMMIQGMPNSFDANLHGMDGSFGYGMDLSGVNAFNPPPGTITSNPILNSNVVNNITQADGTNIRILGDVMSSIPIGDSRFDNIPVLNEPQFTTQERRLPELSIPQNDSELAERIDALLARFTTPTLALERSTPGRVLRYSLVGGVEETFLISNTQAVTADQLSKSPALESIYALGALCWNKPCANRQLLRESNDHVIPTVGAGFQSQRGELLAALAFARVTRDYEMRVGSNHYSVNDLIAWEKYSCSSHADLTLVAVGLAYYSQNPDETWENAFGETWSLGRILEEETRRPVDWGTPSCVDKLLAFSYLVARLKQSAANASGTLTPTLTRIERFLVAIKARIWELYGDNNLSNVLFFNAKTTISNPYMSLYVNGKLFRWLTIVASPEEIQSSKMKRAAAEICALVDQLFNSIDNLEELSAIDEDSLCIALQALATFRKTLPVQRSRRNFNEKQELQPESREAQERPANEE